MLISGRGSNMLRVLDAVDAGQLPATPAVVLSDTPTAAGLALAAQRGIETAVCVPRDDADRDTWARALTAQLEAVGVELVALAGFMRVLPTVFCTHWQGRLLNIHPSLLPRHKGLDTHQRALDAGDREAGCSVHFVTAELDGGPVIAQSRVAIQDGETAGTLAERVLKREHVLYPQVLTWCATGRITLRHGHVHWDNTKLAAPLEV
ncbi:MAG: phosphoribosylglycinamide formyltransferase [Pseudomonadota bacterium]